MTYQRLDQNVKFLWVLVIKFSTLCAANRGLVERRSACTVGSSVSCHDSKPLFNAGPAFPLRTGTHKLLSCLGLVEQEWIQGFNLEET